MKVKQIVKYQLTKRYHKEDSKVSSEFPQGQYIEQAKRDSAKITGETRWGKRKMRDYKHSLRGRCLKGKGKGVLGARETRGAHEEGGKKTPARRPLVLLVCNIHQANDKGTRSAMGPR